MSEEASTTPEKQFSLQKIYTKDISFETPGSPKVFTEKFEPAVDLNLATNSEKIDENIFEVTLTVTATVKTSDTTAYLVEACQAGIFLLSGFEETELGPMLGSFCPNILFPYVREVVSDLVAKGGFPQLLLAPVNFDAIYAQHLQQSQQQTPGSNMVN